MARKTKTVIIPAEEGNRDRDKVFIVTEMSAEAGEWWAMRAVLAICNSNVDLGKIDNVEDLGWVAMASIGLQALSGVDPNIAKPLLDELMACVRIMPDPSQQHITMPIGFGGADSSHHIEEISTRVLLRKEAFLIHANFSEIVARLVSRYVAAISPAPIASSDIKT